ncbi:MAG: hypothetical protein ABGZ35_12225, partial [Planctomycetaceae bacterium]
HIFTWGSNLGLSVEEFLLYKPIPPFNDWVLLSPLIAVWVTIFFLYLSAEYISRWFGSRFNSLLR